MKLKRETYLEQIRPYYESDIVKVITGVRRAGKSIFLDTIKDELKENGVDEKHIIYINLNYSRNRIQTRNCTRNL